MVGFDASFCLGGFESVSSIMMMLFLLLRRCRCWARLGLLRSRHCLARSFLGVTSVFAAFTPAAGAADDTDAGVFAFYPSLGVFLFFFFSWLV